MTYEPSTYQADEALDEIHVKQQSYLTLARRAVIQAVLNAHFSQTDALKQMARDLNQSNPKLTTESFSAE